MKILENAPRVPSYVFGLLLFSVILGTELYLARMDVIKFKADIDLFGIAGIPAFLVTIIELMRTHRIQAAELVRAHMSAFLTNEELRKSFHDLIYNYSDDDFDAVMKAKPASLDNDAEKTSQNVAKVWASLKKINEGREEGSRFYNPDFFQGSLEEKRLDAVLHYFDVLAYNYRNGLISVRNIRGVAGYHLAVIGTRNVTKYLLSRNASYWKNLDYDDQMGAEPPFENLRQLLKAVKVANSIRFLDEKKATVKRGNEGARS